MNLEQSGSDATIDRLSGLAAGRSAASMHAGLIWLVASSLDKSLSFDEQVAATFDRMGELLLAAGGHRQRLLSVTVYLAQMSDKARFDSHWREWVGPDRDGWPQRCVVEAGLSPGSFIEITAIAAR